MRQFLVPVPGDGPAAAGQTLPLEPDEARHLKTVLRAEPDRILALTDGRGFRYTGRLTLTPGEPPAVEILTCRQDDREVRPPLLVLAVAMVKGKRFEWALEKACELGVHRIIPLQTAFTVVRPGDGKRERWRAILTAALKQSGRCLLPELTEPMPLAGVLAVLSGRVCYGVSPGAERDRAHGLAPEPAAPQDPDPICELAVCIGPEGGWSPEELDMLSGSGAEPLALGPHVLRTETAAVAAMVVLQQRRRRALGWA